MNQHRIVEEIEKQLNEDFENIWDWFIDNKLHIHFGEDKTELPFLQIDVKSSVRKLNTKCKCIEIKQHSQITYLKKQPPEVLCKKSCSKKFRKIHRKTLVPERPVHF